MDINWKSKKFGIAFIVAMAILASISVYMYIGTCVITSSSTTKQTVAPSTQPTISYSTQLATTSKPVTPSIKSNKSNVKIGVIKGGAVNLRKGPSKSARIIGLLHKGNQVSSIKKQGNWYNVKTSKGIIGWVSDSLLTIKK